MSRESRTVRPSSGMAVWAHKGLPDLLLRLTGRLVKGCRSGHTLALDEATGASGTRGATLRSVLDDLTLASALAAAWRWRDVSVAALDAGMNSRTWWVDHDGARSVAKWVPAREGGHLLAGVRAARLAGAGGLRTGTARPREDGGAVLELADGLLVVLEPVPGEELTGEAPGDAETIGRTLATAHRATLDRRVTGAWEFPWVEPDAPHLAIDEEVRDAMREVVRAVDAIPPSTLTVGICHGDPTPEAFLADGDEVGLIDWGSCVNGPLLYDLGSAAMYLGGLAYAPPMLASYVAAGGPVPQAEVDEHLSAFLRWRWANQADYFAGRIAADDRTGLGPEDDNRQGFEHARQRLLGDS